MLASRVRRASVTATLSFGLILSSTAVGFGAGPTLPLPDTMAAVGDSITQAASSSGALGVDTPQNSWSTGTNTGVNSHYLRLSALGAPITGRNFNFSVSGAKVGDLPGQMTNAATVAPDYVTVLIGGNDVCTATEAQMTSVAAFQASFATALNTLWAASPSSRVYVVSIPRVLGLWELFRNDFWARFIWSIAGICQSLLANPGSTAQADVDRRARVDQRNRAFNDAMAAVCAQDARCLWDGYAAFNTPFTTGDVSGDYFHPSTAGQAKLAAVSWGAGYTWAPPNRAPTASFTHSCTGLTCTFDDTSTDSDGTIVSRSWSFGGSADPQPFTFAAAGTYPVILTVTDDDGATATATASVTVVAPAATTMRIADLSGSSTRLSSSTWQANVTILVTTPAGAPVAGATVSGTWDAGTAADGCTTTALGTCTVTSDALSRTATRRVTFSVANATHATFVYDPAASLETSITVNR